MKDVIKEKLEITINLLFILSIVSIIASGLLKFIFNIEVFDMEINKNISNFCVFKNTIFQSIILQFSLMFNYALVIAISNKTKIKSVFRKIWFLLILTWAVNLFNKSTTFYMTSVIAILINTIYCFRINNKNIKDIVVSNLTLILISILTLIYQYITIFIRLNHIPQPDEIFSFYEQIVYLFDMYIIMIFYYIKQRKVA